jgi:hypothetical protein
MANKSFVSRIEIDSAKRGHNCQHSRKHRISKGDKRLKVSEGYSTTYYCRVCAIKFLEIDSQRIASVLNELRSQNATDNPADARVAS